MEFHTLNAAVRGENGNGPSRRLRKDGRIPGIIYGEGEAPFSVSVDAAEFKRFTVHHRGEHGVLNLVIDGDDTNSGPMLLKEVQPHPVKGYPMHLDFIRVKPDKPIRTQVPIKVVGLAPGVVKGGVLEFYARTVTVECLPGELPEHVDADISKLELGQRLYVGKIVPPEHVTILTDPKRAVAGIAESRATRQAGMKKTAEE